MRITRYRHAQKHTSKTLYDAPIDSTVVMRPGFTGNISIAAVLRFTDGDSITGESIHISLSEAELLRLYNHYVIVRDLKPLT